MFYVETNVDYSDTQGLFNQTFTSVAIVFRLFSRTAPSWLVSSVGRALQRYRRGQGFESRTSLNFFRLSFPNYKSCVYNRDDLLSYNSSPRSSHIWFSYIHNFIIILSRVYNEPIQRPAPSWLVSSIGRALHRYRRGQGFESRTSLNFFRLSFRICKSCVYNCDDHPSFNSSLRSSHIWFSYIQNFIIILSQVYNEPIQRPAPSWLVSLIGRALHRFRGGEGFESRTSLNFFQAFFSQLQKLRL